VANTYETLELDEGAGGGKIAGDEFTQSAVTKFMPSSTLSVPDGAGEFNRVGDAGISLPVVEDNSADALAALTALIGHVDGLESLLATLGGHVDGLETLLGGVALESGGNLAAAAGGIGDAADAAAAQGGTGSLSAKLRLVTTQLNTISGYFDGVETLLAAATPAGTNLIGLVSAGADASTRYNGATALIPKFANIDVASSGDNQLVAAVSGKTLRVLSVFLAASGAVDAVFNDGTANLLGGTRKIKLDNTGAVGPGGFALQENRTGWFQTGAVNRPINLNLSGATGVAGCLTYVEV